MLINGHEVKGMQIIGVCSCWNDCFCLAQQKYSLMNKNIYIKGKGKKKGAEQTRSSTEEWEVSFQSHQEQCREGLKLHLRAAMISLSPPSSPPGHHRILEWFRLEGALKITKLQPPTVGRVAGY